MSQPITKIVETCHISPPAGSVPSTNTPLTFFDMVWFSCFPKRLFFFELPGIPTDHFTLTVVPKLKHSLSQALIHFFPLAGLLVSPPEPEKPYLRFSAGVGSVTFTVAESGAEFGNLASNEARDVAECHSFVPTLPPAFEGDGGAREIPVLAVQVTVFPGHGFAVGTTYFHAACDGRSFLHFLRSWSLLCRSSENQELTLVDLPCHDRASIVDQYGLEPVYLREWWAVTAANRLDAGRSHDAPENTVRATFIMGRAHIQKLKHSVSAHYQSSTLYVSSFVVTIAFTWVNLIKTQKQNQNITFHLLFPADCRSRSGFEPPIPKGLFGNCLAPCFVSMKRNEMISKNGVLATAKAIGDAIKEMRKEPLRGSENMMSNIMAMARSGNLISLNGSKNIGLYKVDFGWGNPKKSLVTHTDASGGISVAECIGEGGGMEIGLALNKENMSTFTFLFERTLALL